MWKQYVHCDFRPNKVTDNMKAKPTQHCLKLVPKIYNPIIKCIHIKNIHFLFFLLTFNYFLLFV